MPQLVQKVFYSDDVAAKKPHFHDCHQIILVQKGEIEIRVNDMNFRAKAGDVALFSRHEHHAIRICSAEYERYVLQIDPDVVHRSSEVYALLSDRPQGFRNVIQTDACFAELKASFDQLLREQQEGGALSEELEQCILKQMLIRIFRCTQEVFNRPLDAVVQDVKRRFEHHYNEQYALETLAQDYNISSSTLSHRFRAVTGMAVMEYLLSCRMAYAKRMLVETTKSMGEIVETCGFSDGSNFARTFKLQNGISPSEFRAQYK